MKNYIFKRILKKTIISVLFFMIVPINVFAWPAGLVDVGHTGNPNYIILGNEDTKQVAIFVKTPVKSSVYTDSAYNALKSSMNCSNYGLSEDRKIFTGTYCVLTTTGNNREKMNVYAPIIKGHMHMVIYTPSLNMKDVKAISRGQ